MCNKQSALQIPAILAHHEVFLEELRKRLESWDIKQCVGGVFLDTVIICRKPTYVFRVTLYGLNVAIFGLCLPVDFYLFFQLTKPSVIETYTAYINHWKHANEAIKTACLAKSAFSKFLEVIPAQTTTSLRENTTFIVAQTEYFLNCCINTCSMKAISTMPTALLILLFQCIIFFFKGNGS